MLDHEAQAGTAQNQTLPVEFKFENHAVRTIMAGDEIQFVAADVCEVLGIKNPTDAIGRLDDDEKALAFIEGIPGGQRINVVNQFGLTRQKQQAKGEAISTLGHPRRSAIDL
jgi:prophage antirepressor-like protein